MNDSCAREGIATANHDETVANANILHTRPKETPISYHFFSCFGVLSTAEQEMIQRTASKGSKHEEMFYVHYGRRGGGKRASLVDHGRHIGADTVVIEEALDRAECGEGDLFKTPASGDILHKKDDTHIFVPEVLLRDALYLFGSDRINSVLDLPWRHSLAMPHELLPDVLRNRRRVVEAE